jgi:hypothetical protein
MTTNDNVTQRFVISAEHSLENETAVDPEMQFSSVSSEYVVIVQSSLLDLHPQSQRGDTFEENRTWAAMLMLRPIGDWYPFSIFTTSFYSSKKLNRGK